MRSLAILLALLMLPAVAGQNPDAPPWAPDATLLYIDSNDAANGDAEDTGFLSTIQDAGDDAALGAAGTCDPHTGTDVDFTAVPPSNDIDRTYRFQLNPAQGGTATLADGIEAKLYLGAGSCYGEIDVTARLVAGSVVLAEGSVSGHRYNDASGNYPLATIGLDLLEPTFEVAQLELQVHVTGKTGATVFMGIGSSRGFSTIDIPLESLVPSDNNEIVYEDLVGDAVDLSWVFNGTQTWSYNWTGPGVAMDARVSGALSNGTAMLVLAGPGGEAFNQTLSGDINETLALPDVAGNWTVQLQAVDAIGSMRLEIQPTPPAMPDDQVDDQGDDQGNATESPDTKDSPAAPVALLLVGLGLIALRRRS